MTFEVPYASPHSEFSGQADGSGLDRIGAPLTFLRHPFLVLHAFLLTTMLSLSFAFPTVHAGSMLLRWPALAVVALAGLAWAAVRGIGRFTTAHCSLALLVVLAAISGLYSENPSYTLLRAASVGLLFAATGIGLYAFCDRLEKTLAVSDLLWCLAAIVAVGGFVHRGIGGDAHGRYVGLHDRATVAGTYAALFLPIALYHVRYRLRGLFRIVGWIVLGLLAAQIVLTGARMALVSSAVVGLLLAFDYFGVKALLAPITVALLAPAPALWDHHYSERLWGRAEAIVRPETLSTFTGRLDRWRFGLEQFSRRPVLGHGFGTSRTLAGFEEPRRFGIEPGAVFNLHSDQIEVLVDLGLVGFALFASFWLAIGVAGARLVMRPRSAERQLALAYLGGVIYAFGDTFMHGGFLAAGGGISAFTWSMIAGFGALWVHESSFAASAAFRAGIRADRTPRRERFAAPQADPRPTAPSEPVTRDRQRLRERLPSARQLLRNRE